MEDCLDLLEKWEQNKGHYNMVTTDSPEGQNPKEEANVQVVTQGGIRTRVNLEQGESLDQNIKGKIRKETKAPPKFDVAQQNKFLHDA
jgi:hypothetical protein